LNLISPSFLDAIDRICEKNYLPTNDDILRVRISTTGIVQENFQLSRYSIQYELFLKFSNETFFVNEFLK